MGIGIACLGFAGWAVLIAWLAYKYEQEQIKRISALAQKEVDKTAVRMSDEAARLIRIERDKALQSYSDGWFDCLTCNIGEESPEVTAMLRSIEWNERNREGQAK
jgi:hypothetical protein